MTAKTEKVELGEAPFARGTRIEITEEGIRPWQGIVTAVKPSSVSGWWLDVKRDDDAMIWSVRVDGTTIREIAPPKEAS